MLTALKSRADGKDLKQLVPPLLETQTTARYHWLTIIRTGLTLTLTLNLTLP